MPHGSEDRVVEHDLVGAVDKVGDGVDIARAERGRKPELIRSRTAMTCAISTK